MRYKLRRLSYFSVLSHHPITHHQEGYNRHAYSVQVRTAHLTSTPWATVTVGVLIKRGDAMKWLIAWCCVTAFILMFFKGAGGDRP